MIAELVAALISASSALAAVHVYGPPREWIAGPGGRRYRPLTADEATDLRKALKQAETDRDQAAKDRDEARSRHDQVVRHLRLVDAEAKHLRQVLSADAGIPAHKLAAPVDNGSRNHAATAVATVQATLEDLAQTGEQHLLVALVEAPEEKTQQLTVAEVRNAVGEGDTTLIPVVPPVVALDPVPPVTWPRKAPKADPTEKALHIPGPTPGRDAASVPPFDVALTEAAS